MEEPEGSMLRSSLLCHKMNVLLHQNNAPVYALIITICKIYKLDFELIQYTGKKSNFKDNKTLKQLQILLILLD